MKRQKSCPFKTRLLPHALKCGSIDLTPASLSKYLPANFDGRSGPIRDWRHNAWGIARCSKPFDLLLQSLIWPSTIAMYGPYNAQLTGIRRTAVSEMRASAGRMNRPIRTGRGDFLQRSAITGELLPVGGDQNRCTFTGTADGNSMKGRVCLGKYGETVWSAVREQAYDSGLVAIGGQRFRAGTLSTATRYRGWMLSLKAAPRVNSARALCRDHVLHSQRVTAEW